MNACKYYNTKGYYRCALKMQKPCNECGQFEATLIFTDNTILANPHVGSEFTLDTIIGPYNDPNTGANRATVDTVIPDTDMVSSPAHYAGHWPNGVETIDLIAHCMEYIGSKGDDYISPRNYGCLWSELKYRFRAGLKGDAAEDIAKAMRYAEFRREG